MNGFQEYCSLRSLDPKQVLRLNNYDWRAGLRQSSVLLICLGFSAYFAYHTLYGRHGLETRNKLIARSELLEFEIRSLEAVRADLSHEIHLLSMSPPDPDLVEEIARDVMGYAKPEDTILMLR